jgi:hypothetical protein
MSEKFIKQVNIKMSEPRFAYLSQRAAEFDLSLSQYLRICILHGEAHVEHAVCLNQFDLAASLVNSENITPPKPVSKLTI